ncbi:MAG: yjdH [Neobacillus sp.]|jgi:hypothetical protein|nr:yjdH [Neobacillus sp.]
MYNNYWNFNAELKHPYIYTEGVNIYPNYETSLPEYRGKGKRQSSNGLFLEPDQAIRESLGDGFISYMWEGEKLYIEGDQILHVLLKADDGMKVISRGWGIAHDEFGYGWPPVYAISDFPYSSKEWVIMLHNTLPDIPKAKRELIFYLIAKK